MVIVRGRELPAVALVAFRREGVQFSVRPYFYVTQAAIRVVVEL